METVKTIKMLALEVKKLGDGKVIVLDPEVIECAPGETLATLQKAVGGYVKMIPVGQTHADAWLNEDGIARDLPPNPYANALGLVPLDCVIRGTIVIAGHDAQGNTVSLTDDPAKLAQYIAQIRKNLSQFMLALRMQGIPVAHIGVDKNGPRN